MLNLANAYAQGEGVERDTEHAVQIVEAAMALGIPSACDLMGTHHMEGLGVSQDASGAHAFWDYPRQAETLRPVEVAESRTVALHGLTTLPGSTATAP